jgi:DNA-binding protein H-NS
MPRTASQLRAIKTKIRKLNAKAAALKQAHKPGIAQIKAIIAKFKLTPADVRLALKQSRARGKRVSHFKGKKLKPKYRNPKNKNETWAARGLKPKWLSAQLKQGKKLEDFAIQK